MLIKKVSPEQILTLCDFPVHNEHILKMYVHMFRKGQGKIVPPCPVLPLDMFPAVVFGKTKKVQLVKKAYERFLKNHPEVAYVILDGSHKTTAAALMGEKLSIAILRTEKDLNEMRELVEKGEVFSFMGEKTIEACVEDLKKHFLKFGRFETVVEKTARMVSKKVLPAYMLAAYRKTHV